MRIFLLIIMKSIFSCKLLHTNFQVFEKQRKILWWIWMLINFCHRMLWETYGLCIILPIQNGAVSLKISKAFPIHAHTHNEFYCFRFYHEHSVKKQIFWYKFQNYKHNHLIILYHSRNCTLQTTLEGNEYWIYHCPNN